jgi:hypothetical protein
MSIAVVSACDEDAGTDEWRQIGPRREFPPEPVHAERSVCGHTEHHGEDGPSTGADRPHWTAVEDVELWLAFRGELLEVGRAAPEPERPRGDVQQYDRVAEYSAPASAKHWRGALRPAYGNAQDGCTQPKPRARRQVPSAPREWCDGERGGRVRGVAARGFAETKAEIAPAVWQDEDERVGRRPRARL